jgi:cell wall integrity and stress response component
MNITAYYAMKLTSALLAVLPCAFFASASQESYVGCFSTPGSFENLGTYVFQSIGHCLNQCTKAGYNIGDYAAVKETDCYCGDVDPAKDDLVDDDQCTTQCPGYAPDVCE